MDSSSSCESLADETHADLQVSVSNPALALTSTPTAATSHLSADTAKPLGLGLALPPLNRTRVISSSGSAFISYVRRRGEPDGGRTDTESIPSAPDSAASALYPTQDSSLANTTDSELSDGYISQAHINKTTGPRLGYSSLRAPVRVSRPGGGGESDAAFTPSPPVTTQNPVEQNVSMALAHQTRIRNLYSSAGMNYLGDSVIPEMSVVPSGISRRPDSSSSASSTTDWEISGHATVLRRNNQPPPHPGHMPPLPPPRQNLPLVDSLRPVPPMAPVYNNLGPTTSLVVGPTMLSVNLESTSSESEIERGLELVQTPMSHFRLKPKIKLGNAQSSVAARLSKEHAIFMDRLNIRTEAPTNMNMNHQGASGTAGAMAGSRKPLSLPEEDDNALVVNASNLYFSQADTELLNEAKKDLKSAATNATAAISSQSAASKEASKVNQKSIQDSIMRHMNRETPTISEVYHERNLGLGLAPPLSKLLLSKNYDDEPSVSSSSSKLSNTCTIKSIVDAVNELELSGTSSSSSVSTANTKTMNIPPHNTSNSNSNQIIASSSCGATNTSSSNNNGNLHITAASTKETCSICGEPADIICRCKAATMQKKGTLKPWLSNVPSSIVKASELTTADILERQHKIKMNVGAIKTKAEGVPSMTMTNVKRVSSPFNEFCRRDEGDGRSVADSQCSSTYKTAAAVLGNNGNGNSNGNSGATNSKEGAKSATQTGSSAMLGRKM